MSNKGYPAPLSEWQRGYDEATSDCTPWQSRMIAAEASLERVRAEVKQHANSESSNCGLLMQRIAAALASVSGLPDAEYEAMIRICTPDPAWSHPNNGCPNANEIGDCPAYCNNDDHHGPSQPEAPDPHTCDWFGRFTCRVCGRHRDQPEASLASTSIDAFLPQGPAAESEDTLRQNGVVAWAREGLKRDLAAANARIAELTALNQDSCEKWQAANVRIAELEQDLEAPDNEPGFYSQALYDAANARADAAERQAENNWEGWRQADTELKGERESNAALKTERDQLAQKLDATEKDRNLYKASAEKNNRDANVAESERDQLAARVTSMQAELDIAWADDDPKETCTPEERQVLEAMRDYPEYILEEWNRDGTPRRKALAEAELANRAANARIAEQQKALDRLRDYANLKDLSEDAREAWAANARADAAERLAADRWRAMELLAAERDQLAQKLDAAERKLFEANRFLIDERALHKTERDQLAARVTGLEHWYSESPSRCTREERQVLAECRDALILDKAGRAGFASVSESAVCTAELANRAAKGKLDSLKGWICSRCGQKNSYWATECGRCTENKDREP